jgi:hypothetical protein
VTRPLVGDRRTGTWLGLAFFAAGCVLLWDAYEGHGAKTPLPLRLILPA